MKKTQQIKTNRKSKNKKKVKVNLNMVYINFLIRTTTH